MSDQKDANGNILNEDCILDSSFPDSNDRSGQDRPVPKRTDKPTSGERASRGDSAGGEFQILSRMDNTISSGNSSTGSSYKRDDKHLHAKKLRKKQSSESKRRKRKKKKSYSSDDDDDNRSRSSTSTSTSREERKHKRRHRKRKHSGKRYKCDSSELSSSTSVRSTSSNRERKERKRSKKHRKRSHSSRDKEKRSTTNLPTFGKYGILKESDFFSKQRDFEVWLSEVKQIPSFSGPKRELMNYFKEYCEDYNTATLPHEKYYNYDKWEMEEYNKKKMSSSNNVSKTDEMRHLEEMARKKEEKRRLEEERIRQSMNKEKIEHMKRQQLLKHELELAYKTGDEVKRRKLQKQLEPDDTRAKVVGGASHPWSR